MANQRYTGKEIMDRALSPIAKYAEGNGKHFVRDYRNYFLTFPFTFVVPAGGAPAGGAVVFTQPTHRTIPMTHRFRALAVKGMFNMPLWNPEMAIGLQFSIQEPGEDFKWSPDPIPFAILYGGVNQTIGMLKTVAGYVLEPQSELMVELSHNTGIAMAIAGTYAGSIIIEGDMIAK